RRRGAARGCDEPHVEARREGSKQMVRAQMAAGIERPRRLAGDGDDGGPARLERRHWRVALRTAGGFAAGCFVVSAFVSRLTSGRPIAQPDRLLRSSSVLTPSVESLNRRARLSLAPRSPTD